MENTDEIIRTPRYIELARHCIGLNNKKPYHRHGEAFYLPYRNYYAVGRAHEDWEVMVSAGYARRDPDRFTYSLTRAGMDWLGGQIGMTIYDEEE